LPQIADTAAHLIDQLLPEAAISAFLRTLFAWQRRRGV
jgi:hypothetical protein